MERGKLRSLFGLAWMPRTRWGFLSGRCWSPDFRLITFRCRKCGTLESVAAERQPGEVFSD